MGINYAAEKFSLAIYSMATAVGTETGKDRLYSAAIGTHTLDKDDFPEPLWERFAKWSSRMSRVHDEQRGSFRATADSLPDSEVHDLLVEFYNLSVEVEDAYRCTP
jgi:hypothetical protein